tara:strand:+ start:280 stop:954 length:675 start_codon:yes stop_codon:yes gene_type:complete
MISVKNSMLISLIVQIITGLVSLHGVFINLDFNDKILSDILVLETIVQIIEFAFYIWITFSFINIKNLAATRYMDWVITTPTMLLSTIMFMKYVEFKENGKIIQTIEFLKKYKTDIIKIFIFNFGMLACGFVGEIKPYLKYISTLIGFGFFWKTFEIIYKNYAVKTRSGLNLFYFMFFVWGLYGIAALLGDKLKNISYNILDIFSKNFYGLFLYYTILNTVGYF